MTYRHFPPWLILMGLITALGPLAIDMYLPAFVAIADDLQASTDTIELSLASFFIGLAIGQGVYGPLSDRFGRKPPLLFGLALYTLAAAVCALVPSGEALVAIRFVQALGGCAGMVIARAIVRDKTEPQDAAKAFSMLILIIGVAPILAPIAGSWVLSVSGWRAIFWFQVFAGTACLLWAWLGLQETHPGDDRKLSFRRVGADYLELLRHRSFMGFSLTAALAMGGFYTYLASTPALMVRGYGFTPEQYAMLFGTNAAGFILMSQINAVLLRRRSMLTVLRAAIWIQPLAGITLGVMTLVNPLPPLWLLAPVMWVLISSIGLISPNASAAALTQPGLRVGTASALLGMLQFSLATFIVIVVGSLSNITARPLGIVMMITSVAAILVLTWVARPERCQVRPMTTHQRDELLEEQHISK
ncbi:multidrug effflux MFS transporter [Salinispirillum sp. LH 10-3-1]|uniref:Bcr/CflA family efflux transporter n=1 Tax=Salinispirillum sp. LH 10-3-1 TaxID=2952525 RepID=A0AB38YCP5_9GAMM